MSLQQRVNQTIVNNRLMARGERLVVAVSGGPDSVALLCLLHALSAEWNWSLVVAHLNHGFRGAAALADAHFVQHLAQRLGWPAVVEHANLPELLSQAGGSAQEVSRRERYRFLQRVAAETGAQSIVLAHQRGDQAETLLLHLLRGAGVAGLAGMRLREESLGCTLVRPLLGESRCALLDYLRELGQGFRVDVSNTENHYLRNRLRLDVLPLLAAVNPEVETALARTANLVQAEDQLLGQLAADVYSQVRLWPAPNLALSLPRLQQQPLALQRRLLRLAWQELTGQEQDLAYSHVEAAVALPSQAVGASCNWPRGYICRRDHNELRVLAPEGSASEFDLPLPLPGGVCLPHGLGQVSASCLPAVAGPWAQHGLRKDLASSPDRVYCDGLALTGELRVRTWLPGDEFRPLGMAGRKKLQDFFTDRKVDRERRRQVPLVTCNGCIVWVAGYRLADPFRVTPCSREVVCLEYIHPVDN